MTEVNRVLFDLSQPSQELTQITREFDKYNLQITKNAELMRDISDKGKKYLETVVQLKGKTEGLIVQLQKVGAVSRVLGSTYVKNSRDVRAYAEALHQERLALINNANTYQTYIKARIAASDQLVMARRKQTQEVLPTEPQYSDKNMSLATPSGPNIVDIARKRLYDQSYGKFASTVAQMKESIKSGNEEIISSERKKADAVKRANDQILLSWHSVIRIVQAQVLFRLISLTVQQLHEGVREAQEFSIRIGEIQTISDRAGVSNARLGREIRSVASEFGAPILQVAEGYYQAISNQMVTAATATAFMREEMKLALATVSTLDNAVNATSSVLLAYNLSATEASRVNAILFKGVDIGRFRLDDLANSLGRTAVFAKQLGMTVEEQFASITLLTRVGLQPERAQTYLANIQMHLIKPTEALVELYKEWGVTSGEMAVQTFTFAGVLQKLADAAARGGDRLEELGKIMQDMRALAGSAVLVGFVDKYKKDLEAIQDLSGDQYKKAIQLILETPGQQLKIQTNQAKLYFMDLGTAVMENMLKISDSMGGLAKTSKLLVDTGKNVAIMLIAWKGVLPALTSGFNLINSLTPTVTTRVDQFGQTVTSTTVATRTLGSVLKSLWLTAGIPAAIFATVVALDYFRGASERAKEKFKKDQNDIIIADRKKYDDMITNLTKFQEEYRQKLNEQMQTMMAFLAELNKANTKIIEDNNKILKLNAKLIGQSNSNILSEIDALINTIEKKARKATEDAQRALDDIERMKMNVADQAFDDSLIGKTDIEKLKIMKERYIELIKLTKDYLAKGQFKEYDEARRQSVRVEDQSMRLAEKIKNQAAKEEQRTNEKQVKDDEKAAQRKQKIWNDHFIRLQTLGTNSWKAIANERKRLIRALAQEEAKPNGRDIARPNRINEVEEAKRHEEDMIRERKKAEVDILKMRMDGLDALNEKATENQKKAEIYELRKKELQEQFTIMANYKLSEETPASDYSKMVATTEEMMIALNIDKERRNEALKYARIREKTFQDQEKALAREKEAKQLGAQLVQIKEAEHEALRNVQEAESEINKELQSRSENWTKSRERLLEFKDPTFLDKIRAVDTASMLTPTVENMEKQVATIQDLLDVYNKWVEQNNKTDIGRKMIADAPVTTFMGVALAQRDMLQASITRLKELKAKAIETGEQTKLIDEQIKKIPEEYQPAINRALAEANVIAHDVKKTADEIERIIKRIVELMTASKDPNILQNMPWGQRLQQFGFAAGGRVNYMASGGPMGTDRIPAMLAKGEYVWDSRTVALNYPVIRGLHQGGRVTNVGDVNISVRGGDTSDLTIRNIARGLRREIRRGTVRLN